MSKIPIFDTHAHLDREEFDSDRKSLLRRLESGTCPGGLVPDELAGYEIEMTGVVIPAVDAVSSRKCVGLAAQRENFFPAVGIHPNHTHLATEEDWRTVAELAEQDGVVAVGETGLDRYWDDAPIKTQIEFLYRHLALSRKIQKPVLVHCRDAWDDLLPVIRTIKNLTVQNTAAKDTAARLCIGVIHAFSGTAEQALECIEHGWMISFAGSLTYRNAKFAPLWEAAKQIPLDRLLIETDSPFMVPHPLRGKLQRNEPVLAALVVKRLSELRNEPLAMTAAAANKNAERIFRK
ncbi:MAG: TatD family hydrolase [Planctomycetaceae bacterium]|jgi:TatD DNase family protein|nr:TatD family hydrolase [Planctomycetaceae bacterium]